MRACLPAILPGPPPSPSTTKGCIKVVTGTSKDDDGRATVYIDQGTGFEAATTVNKYYDDGDTVLDACYANLKAVRMQNTDTDGWIGSVTFASSKAGPYKPGYCTTCTKKGSTAFITVDGNGNGVDYAPVACVNGNMCDITFNLDAPTSGESSHHVHTHAATRPPITQHVSRCQPTRHFIICFAALCNRSTHRVWRNCV